MLSFAGVIAVTLFLQVDGPVPPPVFDGRPLSYWAKLLESDDSTDLQAALEALQQMGADSAAARRVMLEGAVHEGELQPMVQIGAALIRAYGRFGKQAVPEVIEALDHPDPVVRRGAVTAIGAMKQNAAAAVPALIARLEAGDRHLTHDALVSLRVVGPAAEQSIPYLTKLLHGGDAKEIKAALRVIESIGPRAESLRSELLSQLHVSDRENRKAAIAAVATVFPNGDPEIVDALASTLDAESEDVVESSIIALEVMGPGAEAALPELRKQFDHPGYGIAAQAAIAAWKIGEDPKTVLPVLLRKLKDPDQSYLAAVALGMMGKDAAPAVNSLIALLDAEKLQIRISAVQALGKIGPHASAVATAALAGHAELEQDRHVASYAVSLWQIDRNADQCLPLIKRGLLAADASDKLQLLQIVTKIGPAAAELRPLLKSLQNDFNPEVSEAASVAASALKDHR